MNAIEFQNVNFAYQGIASPEVSSILQGFSLAIQQGKTTALLGSSGSGKSTVAKLANRILIPREGRVLWSTNLEREHDVVYVDQDPLNSVFPWLTVERNLNDPLAVLGWSKKAIADRVSVLLELFRLKHIRHSEPKSLSGGEMHRLALARSLSWCPRVAVLDETLSSLDPPTRKMIFKALRRIVAEDDLTLIVITHYLDDALDLADRILVVGGRPTNIVEDLNVDRKSDGSLDASSRDQLMIKMSRSIREAGDYREATTP